MTNDGSTTSAPGSTASTTSTVTKGRTVKDDGTVVTKQSSLLKPATYGQMLQNARVHDADGNLSDHENSVTPGTLY